MIQGSGPLDRNENMRGMRGDVFNTIAHHLAAAGIGSLRYDKRGCGQSTGDYGAAGFFDLADDAAACLKALRGTAGIRADRLYLLGHSEGCFVAPQVAARDQDIAGLVLLCPEIADLETVLMKQGRQGEREIARLRGLRGFFYRLYGRLIGGFAAKQKKLVARLKSADWRKARVPHMSSKLLHELLLLSPPKLFEPLRCPLLLIGGEKDLQCDPAAVNRIAALVKAPAEAHVVPNLTHALRFDERPATMFGQLDLLGKPVEPEVLDLIAGWLRARTP